MSGGEQNDAFVTIARVAKTQGRHGEVAAEILTDFPGKFAERKRLLAWLRNGTCSEVRVENHWLHKNYVVLKFAGVDSISEAEKYVGCELRIPLSERAPVEEGAYYTSDLAGCAVLDWSSGSAVEVGIVKDVRFGAGKAPMLVVSAEGREHLIPFVETFLRKVDVPGRRIEMLLPAGLLELDAPLTEEEKKQQRQKN